MINSLESILILFPNSLIQLQNSINISSSGKHISQKTGRIKEIIVNAHALSIVCKIPAQTSLLNNSAITFIFLWMWFMIIAFLDFIFFTILYFCLEFLYLDLIIFNFVILAFINIKATIYIFFYIQVLLILLIDGKYNLEIKLHVVQQCKSQKYITLRQLHNIKTLMNAQANGEIFLISIFKVKIQRMRLFHTYDINVYGIRDLVTGLLYSIQQQ